jgi:hypothetical protein
MATLEELTESQLSYRSERLEQALKLRSKFACVSVRVSIAGFERNKPVHRDRSLPATEFARSLARFAVEAPRGDRLDVHLVVAVHQ